MRRGRPVETVAECCLGRKQLTFLTNRTPSETTTNKLSVSAASSTYVTSKVLSCVPQATASKVCVFAPWNMKRTGYSVEGRRDSF